MYSENNIYSLIAFTLSLLFCFVIANEQLLNEFFVYNKLFFIFFFLQEFHATAGSKITCQTPPNFISKHAFDLINAYILPKRELEKKILTVNTLNIKIVGYPVKIDHEKYARNAFYFNICFVCDHYCRSVQYEPIVKKLSEFLIMMEMEYSFLSKEEYRPRIQLMLNKIITDLNESRVCTIIEEETTIHLKIAKIADDPPEVYDYQVPILKKEFENISHSWDSWDLTTQQVLPYINSIFHVAKIATLADVENALVKSCIQNLVYYNVVELLPLFKYSNVYMCTRNLQKLARNQSFAQECLKHVALKDDQALPSMYSVFKVNIIFHFLMHSLLRLIMISVIFTNDARS